MLAYLAREGWELVDGAVSRRVVATGSVLFCVRSNKVDLTWCTQRAGVRGCDLGTDLARSMARHRAGEADPAMA